MFLGCQLVLGHLKEAIDARLTGEEVHSVAGEEMKDKKVNEGKYSRI